MRLDVTNEADWKAVVDATVQKYGKLDILVNNAGISGSAVSDMLDTDAWDRLMAVNSRGVFLGTKYAVLAMKQAGGGSIVNLSSISGNTGQTMTHMGYNASKGAVRTLTKSTAVQFGRDGIRANSVHPGLMPPMRTSGATADPDGAGEDAARRAAAPRRRGGRGGERHPVPGVRRGVLHHRRRTLCRWRLSRHVAREDRAMTLSRQQLQQFDREGYLFLPDLFSAEEIAVLRGEAEAIFRTDRKEIWREKSGSPRTAFAAHTYNEAFRLLGAHPRLIRPVEQVFGEQLYMHQFKINAKSAFDGEVWQWHQDYGTWARDDGMPEPRAMNISVFVDEVLPINGPLMLVPRSHKEGVLKAGHDLSTTSYPLWTLDNATVERLVRQGGIVTPTGKPGAVLMFHGNLVHGSAGNITPYPRKIVYLTLNAVSNYIRTPTRPDWIAHRDFRPIEPVADEALARYALACRVAAE